MAALRWALFRFVDWSTVSQRRFFAVAITIWLLIGWLAAVMIGR